MKEMNNPIDQKLQSPSQVTISKIVSSLDDDAVSMVWRSNLNEALRLNMVKAKRRKFFVNVLSPLAGLSAACVLALAFMVKPGDVGRHTSWSNSGVSQSAKGSSSLEAELVRLHQDDVRQDDVTGSGLGPADTTNNRTSQVDDNDDWADQVQL